MDQKDKTWRAVSLTAHLCAAAVGLAIGVALLAACTSPAGTPGASPTTVAASAVPTMVPTQTNPARTSAPTAAPTPTPQPPATQAPPTIIPPTVLPTPMAGDYTIGERDFILRLNADGSAILGVPVTGRADFSAAWRGTWRATGAAAEARFTETADRAPMEYPAAIRFVLVNQQVDITQYGVNDIFYDRDDLDYTLGSGQRHPLVKLLNQLLTKIHYLNYIYPTKDDDLYTDFVRRAVANFQEIEGLTPDGVADQRTWLQLLSPALQTKITRTDNQIVIGLDVVNIRSGPATNYPAIDRRYKGEALDVIGKKSGASADATWYQICCVDREHGWLRSDTGQFQGVIGSVPEVPAASDSPHADRGAGADIVLCAPRATVVGKPARPHDRR